MWGRVATGRCLTRCSHRSLSQHGRRRYRGRPGDVAATKKEGHENDVTKFREQARAMMQRLEELEREVHATRASFNSIMFSLDRRAVGPSKEAGATSTAAAWRDAPAETWWFAKGRAPVGRVKWEDVKDLRAFLWTIGLEKHVEALEAEGVDLVWLMDPRCRQDSVMMKHIVRSDEQERLRMGLFYFGKFLGVDAAPDTEAVVTSEIARAPASSHSVSGQRVVQNAPAVEERPVPQMKQQMGQRMVQDAPLPLVDAQSAERKEATTVMTTERTAVPGGGAIVADAGVRTLRHDDHAMRMHEMLATFVQRAALKDDELETWLAGLWDTLPERSRLLRCNESARRWRLATDTIRELKQGGYKLGESEFLSLLRLQFASPRPLETTLGILQEMHSTHITPSMAAYEMVFKTCAKWGNASTIRTVFDFMRQHNGNATQDMFHVIAEEFSKRRDGHAVAATWLREMAVTYKMQPGSKTYALILKLTKNPQDMMEILRKMHADDIDPEAHHYNQVLERLVSEERSAEAVELFDSLVQIQGVVASGDSEAATQRPRLVDDRSVALVCRAYMGLGDHHILGALPTLIQTRGITCGPESLSQMLAFAGEFKNFGAGDSLMKFIEENNIRVDDASCCKYLQSLVASGQHKSALAFLGRVSSLGVSLTKNGHLREIMNMFLGKDFPAEFIFCVAQKMHSDKTANYHDYAFFVNSLMRKRRRRETEQMAGKILNFAVAAGHAKITDYWPSLVIKKSTYADDDAVERKAAVMS